MEAKVEYIDGIFVCTASGVAEVGAVAGLIDAMLTHPQWRPGSPRCYDISNLDAGTLTQEDIRRISVFAAEHQVEAGGGKIAFAVSRDLEYGLSRMLSAFISQVVDLECQVFRSVDEARAWLSA